MADRPHLNIPTLPRHEPDDGVPTNGSTPPEPTRKSDARGGMIATRTPWLDLPPPFENLEIRAWLDYPKPVADLWTPADNETREETAVRAMLACQNTFLDHREACQHPGNTQTCTEYHEPWQDGEGVLPPTADADFWERIPTPLYRAVVERFVEEINDNPTNRASRRWKRKSSRRR